MGLAMVRPTLKIEGSYKPKGGIKDLVLGVYVFLVDHNTHIRGTCDTGAYTPPQKSTVEHLVLETSI